MDRSAEYALVLRAILHPGSQCFRWRDSGLELRVREDRELRNLLPRAIRQEVKNHVAADPSILRQKDETRPEYRDRFRFTYQLKLHCFGDILDRPLFVEMRLERWDDEEFPLVTIVSVHLDRD